MNNLSKLKVLVIDDVHTVRTVLINQLKALGVLDIVEAGSSVEGWKILESADSDDTPIELIFCDWIMPGGDGIDLLGQIRSSKNDCIRLTKFVMITGANQKVNQAMEAGANNIIHKPFTIDVLKFKLEILFNHSIEMKPQRELEIFSEN